MDYNGLSIVSPQYYPDDEEWKLPESSLSLFLGIGTFVILK